MLRACLPVQAMLLSLRMCSALSLDPAIKWSLGDFGWPAWRITPVSKLLGSPPSISHEVRPFGTGPTTPGIGELRSPWLLTTYPNWDDPPSDQFCFDVAMICLLPLKESLAIPLTCVVFKCLPEFPLFTDTFAVQKDPRKCNTLCNQKSKYLLQFQLFTNQKFKNKLTK